MASKTAKDHHYTEAEKQFLRDNIQSLTYCELTKAFNSRFGTSLNECSISDVCLKRMGIKRDHPSKFPKGRKSFVYSCPIGAERTVGEQTFVKVSDVPNVGRTPSKGNDPNWKEKQFIVYEQAHGAIPDNKLIVFLDKDRKNFDIENLYCVDRKVNFMMAKNGWYSTDREITLTAIKWCELFYAMKGASKDERA